MLQSVLAWLSSPPPSDPRHELVPLKYHLKTILETGVEARRRLQILELLQSRIDFVASAMRPELLEARLPLPQRLRGTASSLMDIHGLAAAAYLNSLREMPPEMTSSISPEALKCCFQAILNLSSQQRIGLFVASSAPVGLWAGVREVVSLLPAVAVADGYLVEQTLKSMLAMAAVQPESFTARHLGFLADYLDKYAAAVEIARQPIGNVEAWYWMEEGRDLPPVAVARRPPSDHGVLLYYSCSNLSRIAGQHLLQLASGEPPSQVLFATVDANACQEALAQAQRYWSHTPLRHSHRRQTHFRVKICAGFSNLWNLLHSDPSTDGAGASRTTTEWMVLNEGAGGYALMHVSGVVTGLVPGEILGVWLGDEHPWSVGIVRWVRSDNPEHLELGLEMISPSTVPAQLVRATGNEADFVPVLLISATSGVDRGEALMTERTQAGTGAYLLIRETGSKLQLTRCELQHSTLQTASVEVFEFRRNFAPD